MKNSLLIINLIVILTIGAAIFFGQQEFRKLKQSYIDLNAVTESLTAQKEAARLLGETVDAREIIAASVVSAEDLPGFIGQLEKLADETGAKINLQSASEADNTNPNTKLDFNLNGSYQALFRFTLLLDALPFQIKISQVSFNREGVAERKKSLPTWRAHFVIELLNLPTKK